ncbi:MAG: zinc-binding dehydrogenase, partial [Leptospirales bacterium]
MKHAVLTKIGGPESLELQETTIPKPLKDELLVKVDHAGVAFADVMMRHGKYPSAPKLPFTPGYDICGTVVETGDNVSDFNVGDKIIALTQFGGYAQYATVHHGRAIKVPELITTSEAVVLVLNYISAYQMLTKYKKLTSGNTVLIHSAAGGVGTAALQIARTMGLKTYGTCSTGKTKIVEQNGGIAIDYKTVDFAQQMRKLEPDGVDFILDPIGGNHWIQSKSVLKPKGTLVGFGFFSMFQNDKVIGSIMDIGKIMIPLILGSMLPGAKKFHMYSIKPNQYGKIQ